MRQPVDTRPDQPAMNFAFASADASGRGTTPNPLPRNRQPRTIRFRLACLVMACVLPVYVIAGFLVYYSYRHKQQALETSALVTARAFSLLLDRELVNMEASMTALATSPSLDASNMAAFYRQAQLVLHDYPEDDIILEDTNGQELVDCLVPLGRPLPERIIPNLATVHRTGRPSISNLFVEAGTGRHLVSVDVPVFRDNKVVYDLSLNMPAEQLNAIFKRVYVPSNWTSTIFDRNKAIVARNRLSEKFVGHQAGPVLSRRMSEFMEGSVEGQNQEGLDVITMFDRSINTGWAVVIGIPRPVFLSEIWQSLRWAIVLVILLSASGICLGLFLARRIGASIRALIAPALALGSGSPVNIDQLDLVETSQVGNSLVKASELLQQRAAEREQSEAVRRQAEELERSNEDLLRREADAQAHAAELSAIITERQKAEEKLRISEEKFAKAFAGNPAGIALVRLKDEVFLDVNDTWASLTGYSREESVGHTIREVNMWLPPEANDIAKQLRQTGSLREWEVEFRKKSGETFVGELSAQLLTIGGEQLVLSTVVDITERKRAEVEINLRNAVLSGINTIFEEAITCESDKELGQTCLRVAEQITGSRLGFIGEIGPDGRFHDLAAGDVVWDPPSTMYDASGNKSPSVAMLGSLYEQVLREGKTLLTNEPGRHSGGCRSSADGPQLTAFLGVPLIDQGRTVGLIAVADRKGGYGKRERESLEALAPTIVEVLHRKRGEKAIRESRQQNEFLASIIDRTTQAFAVSYPDGQLGLVNHAFEQLTGYTANELRSVDCYRTLTPLEWEEVDQKKLEELHRTGRPVRYEKEYIRKNGSRVPIEQLVHLVTDADGKPQYYFSFLTDITERKRGEQVLIRSEKLASAGRMAATVAHEINNPLEAISNAVYLAWMDPSISKDGKSHLDIAVQELRRVAHLAQRTLGFYREHTTSSMLDLRSVVDSVLDLFTPRLKAREIAVERRFAEVEKIQAVDGEIRQIVSNLLSNSFDAMERPGKIVLRIKPVSTRNGRAVRLTVADTGTGIAHERMSKIFEPFFTTKETVGTGLGLWVTKELVQKHNGTIRVRSKVGKGTIFSIDFPVPDGVEESSGE